MDCDSRLFPYSHHHKISTRPTQTNTHLNVKTSVFLRKLFSKWLWLNLLAMACVLVMLWLGVSYALNRYTHHGEVISVPDVRNHGYMAAVKALEEYGFDVEINDTGYNKKLPPGTVLDQLPEPGRQVKVGRIIYLTINALETPTIILPDIIDNCSMREAIAKLQAKGLKVGEPQMVPGEKNWVYGILVDGHNVAAGNRISKDATLILQVGNGLRDARDSIYMTDVPASHYEYEEGFDEFDDFDDNIGIEESSGDDFEVIE